MRYIDSFCHYFPQGVWNKISNLKGAGEGIGKRMAGVPAIYDLDERRRVCDMFRVKHNYSQVISLGMPPLESMAGLNFRSAFTITPCVCAACENGSDTAPSKVSTSLERTCGRDFSRISKLCL